MACSNLAFSKVRSVVWVVVVAAAAVLFHASLLHSGVTLCSDENPEHREGVEQLRANVEFGAHVVAVALQKLQQIVDKGTCDGAGCGQDKLFTHCCTLGR